MTVSSSRRLLSVIAALALIISLVVAVGVAPATAGGGYQKPHVGQCRNITIDDLRPLTNSKSPIECSETHTAQTIAAKKLSKKAWRDKKTALAAADAKCDKAWVKAVGRTNKKRILSAYGWITFIPTKAQRSHGARWFRCDVILFGGGVLAPLTRTAAPFLSVPIPDSQAHCLDRDDFLTTCDRPHKFRAYAAFKIHKRAYPGKKQTQKLAFVGCRDRNTTGKVFFVKPRRKDWKSGFKWVLCYHKTSN